MELWEVLSNRRKEIGMSFDELHNKTNLSISTLKKILGGHVSAPSFESIRAISYAMDTTLADIDRCIVLLDRNCDAESNRTLAQSMNAAEGKGISGKAMEMALKFDALDEIGQALIKANMDFAFKYHSADCSGNDFEIDEYGRISYKE